MLTKAVVLQARTTSNSREEYLGLLHVLRSGQTSNQSCLHLVTHQFGQAYQVLGPQRVWLLSDQL